MNAARRGCGHDARREMDRQPVQVASRYLDLAGVDARPDLDPAHAGYDPSK